MKILRAIVGAAVLCGAGASLRAQLIDGVKAVIHDSVVTYREVENFVGPFEQQLRRQYRTEPEAYDRKLAEARSESLEQLVERRLILHDFETAGYSLPDSVIEDAVREEVNRMGGRNKLTKTLQGEGMTYEKFRRQIRDQYIVRALRGKHVSSSIVISPHKIETYYLAHQDDYKLEDQVKLRMIVLNKPSEPDAPAVRQLAREILGKIKEGAAFSEMASVYSQGAQRNQGGSYDWVDRKFLRKELSDVAFALKAGEVSDVVETPEACYLMLVEEKRTAHVKPLTDVQEEIERTLLAQEQARLQKRYVDRLKKKTFVRYF